MIPFALVLPVLKFLGDGVLGKMLAHRRELAASKNEGERIKADLEGKRLEHELKRRQAQRDLQLKEIDHWLFRFGKFGLVATVGAYWMARILARLLGIDDFQVYIKPLDDAEEAVSFMVLGYLFLGEKIERFIRSKS